MSLVDYAASSDEDEPQISADGDQNKQVKENPEEPPSVRVTPAGLSSAPPPNDDRVHVHSRMSVNLERTSSKQVEIASDQSSELKLPDASFLLNSPVVPSNLLHATDHSSRVAAAIAEGAARKRDLNGSPASYPRGKVPKGTLPHSKNVPDTVGGRLLPPQLAGRSNVVTEDITKLFVRKPTTE